MRNHDLVVVGGGITGLAAAWEAHQRGVDVVVLEASDRPGGKLRTSPVAGIPIDESADAFLARVPEAVDLCRELGLQDELLAPATGRAYIWAASGRTDLANPAEPTGRVELCPLPQDQLLGIPTDLDGVAASGILSPEALARAAQDLRSAVRQGEPASAPSDPPAGAIGLGRTGSGSGPGEIRGASTGAGLSEPAQDVSVGELVRGKLGDEVYEVLVAPLIGGIWAGDADRLSVEVAAPAIAEARRRDASLIRGAQAVRAAAASAGATDRPVFLAPRSGMGRLVDALVERLGQRVLLGRPVRRVEKVPLAGSGIRTPSEHADVGKVRSTGAGAGDAGGTDNLNDRNLAGQRTDQGDGRRTATRWRLHLADGSTVTAEAVVIATPAPVAAQLLAPHSPRAAEILASIDHAPVTLTTLAVPRDTIDHPLDGSGFLVPPNAGLLLTACSWASSKWEHLAGVGPGSEKDAPTRPPAAGDERQPAGGEVVLLRASAGRDGDDRAMHLDDEELVGALLGDLRLTMCLHAEPADLIDVRIGRWRQGFPQPRAGHLERIADLERALAEDTPSLVAAGAWARGVGIPACIRSARAATMRVLKAE